MEIRSKEFAVRAEAAEVTEEDLKLINDRFALRPLGAEEVYVRRLALCNDQYDRTGERFPRFYLERFAETLPGKPLLAHHDKQQFPLGRFFRAEVQEVSGRGSLASGEAPLPATHDQRPETRDSRGVTWLYCWVYLTKTPGNEEVRAQIDAGIFSHVSVGYRWADLLCDLCARSYFRGDCLHVIGQEYEGRRCTATYGGDPERVEAVEGSLVYLGAQYGAVITKSDNRREEKERLAADGIAPEPKVVGLVEDGRRYREDLRGEIRRLASCVGADREGSALLEALGETPAGKLKELLQEYQERFDALFPPPFPDGAGSPAPKGGLFQFTP